LTDDATPRDITLEDIASAERLMGISYTAQERVQMRGTFDGQIDAAKERRKFQFNNAEPMACRFDPRLPGFQMPPPENDVTWQNPVPAPLPDAQDDIAFASVGQ
jgi:hypothetical protein